MRTTRIIGLTTVALATLLISQTASAQTIRNYGGDAEKQYGSSYQGSQSQQAVQSAQGQTGAVRTAPQQGQMQQGQQAQGEDGETTLEPSHITVFRPGGAQAPLPVDLSPDKMYRGVIPGTRDEVTHLEQARQLGADRSESNRITWVGFQAREDSTRIFFQTARQADYSMGRGEEGAITITFSDTKLSARNFGRYMDTSFFERNVVQLDLDQIDKTTVVATLQLRQGEQPDVDRAGNYLYLDFAHTPSQSNSESTSSADEDDE